MKQCPTDSNLHNSMKHCDTFGSSNEVQVQVKGVMTQVLVDTGSAVSTISRNFNDIHVLMVLNCHTKVSLHVNYKLMVFLLHPKQLSVFFS